MNATKAAKHYAVITSRRRQTFMCPTCGVLGGIKEAIRHNVEHQWDTRQQQQPEPEPVS